MHLKQPIRPRSLVDQAFERIAEAIVIGELVPGERILEAALARQLGISRGVLREAMQRLEGLDLVTRTSNIGVRVAGLSETGISELYVMREALEGMAARLAATNMRPSEINALKGLLERHGRSIDLSEGDGYYQILADDDFHALIARGSGNARLERTLRTEISSQFRLYRYRTSAPPGRAKAAFLEHQRVVEAIIARDPEAAEAAMREHLRRASASLQWGDEIMTDVTKAASKRDTAESEGGTAPKRRRAIKAEDSEKPGPKVKPVKGDLGDGGAAPPKKRAP